MELVFSYRKTIRFLIMLGASFYLYSIGFGVWIFFLDICDLFSSIKEIKENVRE